MTDKTIKQHLQEADSIVKTVTDANALVVKLQRQLSEARDVIELLGNWSHPKLSISPLYGPWVPRDTTSMRGTEVATLASGRISALLGDRA
jgi:hypothetical protein